MKIIITLFGVIVLIWMLSSVNTVSFIENKPSTQAVVNSAITSQSLPLVTVTTAPVSSPAIKNNIPATPSTAVPRDTHLDQLSPEMQQAIKDKLIHHGPKTVTRDEKGRIIFKHDDRFSHMPVAVRQDDGSIKIKEYSYIPQTQDKPK